MNDTDTDTVRAAIQAAWLAGHPRIAADIATENGLGGVCLCCAIASTRYRTTMREPVHQLCRVCYDAKHGKVTGP
jgi:hypothetical protein